MQHQDLALRDWNWNRLSLAEQLGNIGGEISRAIIWRSKDKKICENNICRALELLDLTIQNSRQSGCLKELTRARELLCDEVFGDKKYKTSLEDLNRYFFHFALAARINR